MTRRKQLNVAGLVCGIALGQGAIFVALTILLSNNEVALLAAAGLSYTFITLSMSTADWGQTPLLSRLTAMKETADLHPSSIIVSRVPGALVISVGFVVLKIAFVPGSTGFIEALMPWALVSSLCWCANVIGYLDGRELSGLSGVLTGIAPLFFSVPFAVLPPSTDVDLFGAAVGQSLLLGTVLSLAVQYGLCWRLPGTIFRWRICAAAAKAAAYEGGMIYLGWLPGQLVARGQVLAVNVVLGAHTGGLFVYARQILNGVLQIIAILRRVEFPQLVRDLSVLRPDGAQPVRVYLKNVALQAIVLTAALNMLALLFYFLGPASTVDAAWYAFVLMTIVPFSSIGEGLNSILIAQRRTRLGAVLQWFYLISSLLAGVYLMQYLSYYGLVLAAIVSLVIRAIWAMKALDVFQHAPPAAPRIDAPVLGGKS